MRLREERNKLKARQDIINENLNDIYDFVNQIEL